jgi:hypothetical protein
MEIQTQPKPEKSVGGRHVIRPYCCRRRGPGDVQLHCWRQGRALTAEHSLNGCATFSAASRSRALPW